MGHGRRRALEAGAAALLPVLRALLGIAAGGLLAALCTLVIGLLQLGYRREFLFLYVPGVLVVAHLTGLLPGVVAALGSALLALAFLEAPAGQVVAKLRADLLPQTLYVLTLLLVAVAGSQYRAVQHRLHRDLLHARRREQDEALLVEVTDLLMRQPEEAVALEGVLRRLVPALGEAAAVLRGEGARLTPGAQIGFGLFPRTWQVLTTEAAVVEALMRAAGPAVLGRGSAPVGLGEALAIDRAALLVAPMRFGDEALGALVLAARSARAFDGEAVRAAGAVADRLAAAVHRRRLAEQRRRRDRHTQFISDLMVEFARQQALPALLDRVATRCAETLGQWCAIGLVHAGQEVLRFDTVYHPQAERGEALRRGFGEERLSEHLQARRILEQGRPVVLTRGDLRGDALRALLDGPEGADDDPVVMAVPIYSGGRPLGLLVVGGRAGQRWDEEDLRLSLLIADRAGAAITNARLIEAERRARARAEEEAHRLQALNRIIALAAASTDLGPVFDEFAAALRVLVPFVRVTVSLYVPERDWLRMPYFSGPPLTAPPERFEGPRAGTVRGWVIDHGRPFIRRDTWREAEFAEDALLARAGIRAYLVLPLATEGRVIGTLNFGHAEPGTYTAEHVRLAQPVADQLAVVLSRRQLFEETRRLAGQLAETLQRALLPADLPQPPFTAVAAVYRPADPEARIGGDWYDAFLLPDDRLLVGIGDVAGHGPPAAATMGQVRHVARAYALEGRSPAEILRVVNDLLYQIPGGLHLSMWLALVDIYRGELVYSGGGHPPAVLQTNGEARLLHSSGPPLGIFTGLAYTEERVPFPPGCRLVAYTDGLVEATRDIVEGERRLLAAMAAARAVEPGLAVTRLVDQVLAGGPQQDDLALLVLDALPPEAPLVLTLPAVPENLRRIRRAVRTFAERVGAAHLATPVVLAVGEAVLNVVEHAYSGQPGVVTVRGEWQGEALTVLVADQGQWRAPVERGRGRGALIMRGLADAVVTRAGPRGTVVELRWQVRREEVGT